MESCEYTVMAAGPERDEVIVKNWREAHTALILGPIPNAWAPQMVEL